MNYLDDGLPLSEDELNELFLPKFGDLVVSERGPLPVVVGDGGMLVVDDLELNEAGSTVEEAVVSGLNEAIMVRI